jgi:hypothetical protein
MNDQVLVIDGPARGEVLTTKATCFQAMAPMSMIASADSMIRQMTYYVHRFYLCGRMIRIASLKLLVDDIRPEDAFEYIASDKAKEAAE